MKKNLFYFLCFIACLYLLWALILPFNQGPDEFHRFDVANFIYQYKELPVAGDERLYYGGYGVTYATNLSFPYLIGSLLMFISGYVGSIENLYLAHRMVSVISGIFAVYFVYKIANILNLSKDYKYFLIAFFALVPQFSFINSYINLDSFTVFAIVCIVYLLLKAEKNGWENKYLIYLGIVTGLVLLSYLNGYVIIPAATIYMFLSIKNKKIFFQKISVIIIVALLISGPFFARSLILYNDLLGLETNAQLSEKLADEEWKPSNRQTPFAQEMTIGEMLFERGWLKTSFNSFWAAYGPMSIWLDYKHYVIISIIVFLAGVGLSINGYNSLIKNISVKISDKLIRNRFFIANFIIIILSIFLSVYYSYYSDYQPQGRYIYPAYFSIIFLITFGIKKILHEKYRKSIFFIIISYMLYLNIYSLYKLIFIHFYG